MGRLTGDDAAVATIIRAVRALEAAGCPEAHELRDLLGERAQGKMRILHNVSLADGTYPAETVRMRYYSSRREVGRETASVSLLVTLPNNPTRAAVEVAFPWPDNTRDGRTMIGERALRAILGTNTPSTIADSKPIGRKCRLKVDNTKDWPFELLPAKDT